MPTDYAVKLMENRENKKMEDRLKAPTTLLPSKSTIVKDSDNDFIEDALDKPGTIAKAKLHGSANRILNIPKTFESDQKVVFCFSATSINPVK